MIREAVRNGRDRPGVPGKDVQYGTLCSAVIQRTLPTAVDRHLEWLPSTLGSWIEYEIVNNGSDLELLVNGLLQNHIRDVEQRRGAIAFQAAGLPSAMSS